MMRIKTLAVAVFSSAALAGGASANILVNGGFEAGSGADADTWIENNMGATGSVGRSTGMPHTGSYAAEMSFDNINLPAAGGAYFIDQNLGANTIDNSKLYDFSFWAKAESTNFVGQDIFFQVQWLDQDGSDGGGFKGQEQVSLVGTLTTEYQQYNFNDLAPSAGSDSFIVRFQLSAGAVEGVANTLYVDDVSLTEVPEPGSLALLGLGALAMVRRRRA